MTEVSMILSSIVFCINDLIYLISNKKNSNNFSSAGIYRNSSAINVHSVLNQGGDINCKFINSLIVLLFKLNTDLCCYTLDHQYSNVKFATALRH